ncbi:MAG: transposase [Proteobacteria bacterium]|nr:transposase [Desulfobulbaceae bacterium]MBU4153551.1 transposase [Pseudomonadota bacterium]
MKSRRFTEEQIIGALKQAQAGVRIVDQCRTSDLLISAI